MKIDFDMEFLKILLAMIVIFRKVREDVKRTPLQISCKKKKKTHYTQAFKNLTLEGLLFPSLFLL